MKMTKSAGLFLLAFAIMVTGCSDNSNDGGDPLPPPGPEIPAVYESLPGTKFAENETWTNDTTIAGPHFVLPGVTLTIEAGVTVEFEFHNGNPDNVGTIITLSADPNNFSDGPRTSARLVADGTADNPIVFTSAKANPEINDWGGIILAGRATNNIPGGFGEIEGLSNAVQYGGNDDGDDSGTLRYVRIEYSGFSIAEGSELQALTLYSVGSSTVIENINVFEVSDDGIEIFGGTVDVKYLVVYGADDDSFDYDQGWQGRGQFWVAVQKSGADNGFENDGCDDLSDCGGGNGPTSPQIYNTTIYGAGDGSSPDKNNFGQRLREDLQGSYNNLIIANLDGAPFVLEGGDAGEEGDPTYLNFPDELSLNAYVIWNNGAFQDKSGAGGNATEPDATKYAGVYEEVDPLFTNAASFDFSLQAGSPALSGGQTPPDDGFFDTNATYRGAFGSTDWTQNGSWVRWPN